MALADGVLTRVLIDAGASPLGVPACDIAARLSTPGLAALPGALRPLEKAALLAAAALPLATTTRHAN
jgi:hypothetical protein